MNECVLETQNPFNVTFTQHTVESIAFGLTIEHFLFL